MLKKCLKCGSLVEVLKDCTCDDCGIICCGDAMVEVKSNSVDAAIEKHKPEYDIGGDTVRVYVNHVMESDHYIEWIKVVGKKNTFIKYFEPGDTPEISVPYEKGAIAYSYCNKHSLWETTIE